MSSSRQNVRSGDADAFPSLLIRRQLCHERLIPLFDDGICLRFLRGGLGGIRRLAFGRVGGRLNEADAGKQKKKKEFYVPIPTHDTNAILASI
ncbi:MAG: hypothetical protein JNG86_08595 [Verrucomicrobiaceae bacterium]|nr:hypothetical protein [Verrucomicrobiaceae bacterium]